MQRYFTDKLVDNNFILNDDDMYHIKTVMRMKQNDLVEVVYNNNLYHGSLDNDKIKVIKKIEVTSTIKPEVTLIIPLLKEQKMDYILQKSTELGVDNIVLAHMKHSIIKLEKERLDKKIIRYQKICKEASEQSKRLDIPKIQSLTKLCELSVNNSVNIVCSTRENQKKIKSTLKNISKYDRINIVIGPEGGLALEEEELLNKMGFVSVSLGNQIMRVETVPIYLLSVINYEYME